MIWRGSIQRARGILKYRLKVARIGRAIGDVRALPRETEEAARMKFMPVTRFPASMAWHRLYFSVNGKASSEYVPEDVYYTTLERSLNRMSLSLAYTDKNFHSRYLAGIEEEFTLVRSINGEYFDAEHGAISTRSANDRIRRGIRESGAVFVKPAIHSGGGANVQRITEPDAESRKNDLTIWLAEMCGPDYVCQAPIEQHPDLARVHPESVNTLRIMTLNLNGHISVCSTVLRMGVAGGAVDNQASGGISVGVAADGFLKTSAVTKLGQRHHHHPTTGQQFQGFAVPSCMRARQFVQSLHGQLPHFRLVSWDIAVSPDGKLKLIELNLAGQEINFHQFNNGPIFAERFAEVIEYVRQVDTAPQ